MEKFNNKKEFEEDFISRSFSYLKGKMSEKEAEEFINEFLDDNKKLDEFRKIEETYNLIKKAGEDYKNELNR